MAKIKTFKKVTYETYVREQTLRTHAYRHGFKIRKSRSPLHYKNDGYRLIDRDGNVVIGAGYDLTLDQIRQFLNSGN